MIPETMAGYTVDHVAIMRGRINPASMEQATQILIESKYPPDLWDHVGPMVINKTTKETRNLTFEAQDLLNEAEDERMDAVAIVNKPDGTQEKVYIQQDVVKSVGGSTSALKEKVQTELDTLAGGNYAKPLLILAAVGLVGLVVFKKRRGA